MNNNPIENFTLLELLDILKKQFNTDTEHEFYKELLSAKFLSPITQDSLQGLQGGKNVLNESASIKFIYLNDDTGKSYLPVFTDWKELKKWNNADNIRTLVLSFEDCKRIVFENTPMISGFGAIITPLWQKCS